MNTFNFVVDYQCTIWCRNNLSIQAESRDEAVQRMMEVIEEDPTLNCGHDGIENDWEYFPESEELIENYCLEDPATIEIFEGKPIEENKIWDNCYGFVKKKPIKNQEEQQKEEVLKLLSKAVSGTEKDFFSQEELDEFASWYIKWDSHKMEENAIADSFLEYGSNNQVCRRCAECGRLTKEGWYVNDINDFVCSVTCLSSVLNRLFSENESNYHFQLD